MEINYKDFWILHESDTYGKYYACDKKKLASYLHVSVKFLKENKAFLRIFEMTHHFYFLTFDISNFLSTVREKILIICKNNGDIKTIKKVLHLSKILKAEISALKLRMVTGKKGYYSVLIFETDFKNENAAWKIENFINFSDACNFYNDFFN